MKYTGRFEVICYEDAIRVIPSFHVMAESIEEAKEKARNIISKSRIKINYFKVVLVDDGLERI